MKQGVSGLITDRGLDMVRYARLIEDLGFESLFMGEHAFIPHRSNRPSYLADGYRRDTSGCLHPGSAWHWQRQ